MFCNKIIRSHSFRKKRRWKFRRIVLNLLTYSYDYKVFFDWHVFIVVSLLPVLSFNLSLIVGKPELIERVLCSLDYKSLCNIQCVCKFWYTVVNEGRFWKLQLNHKVWVIVHQLTTLLLIICKHWFVFKVTSDTAWSQIYSQLKLSLETKAKESSCPEKYIFASIFKSVQVWLQVSCYFILDDYKHPIHACIIFFH